MGGGTGIAWKIGNKVSGSNGGWNELNSLQNNNRGVKLEERDDGTPKQKVLLDFTEARHRVRTIVDPLAIEAILLELQLPSNPTLKPFANPHRH